MLDIDTVIHSCGPISSRLDHRKMFSSLVSAFFMLPNQTFRRWFIQSKLIEPGTKSFRIAVYLLSLIARISHYTSSVCQFLNVNLIWGWKVMGIGVKPSE